MKLILHRIKVRQDVTDGYITIGENRICDTAERTPSMLPKGRYQLSKHSHYLRRGNGVFTLREPAIIVGEYRCRGVVIHSRDTYLRIYERLKKAFARGEDICLIVE